MNQHTIKVPQKSFLNAQLSMQESKRNNQGPNTVEKKKKDNALANAGASLRTSANLRNLEP